MAQLIINTKQAHDKTIEYLLRQNNIRAHLVGQGYHLTPDGFVQAVFDKAIKEYENAMKSDLNTERLKKTEADPELAAQIDALDATETKPTIETQSK